MNAYAEEIYKSEQVRTAAKRLCVILDAKDENSDLNMALKKNANILIKIKHNELLKFLQKSEELFDGTLGNWTNIQHKANMLVTISSTEGTQGNVQKKD